MAKIASHRYFWLALSILLLSTGMDGAAADAPDFTFRTDVNEVRLRFSALDQNNHGVATLRTEDFAVVDKGFIVRNFQSFTRTDWTQLDIAILVDASESVTPDFRREISEALEFISQTAGVPDEHISLFSFHGQQPALLCDGNCRASHTADRLTPAQAGGLTPLYDTIILASKFLSQQGDSHSQKILILFSDGDDTISRSSLSDAIDTAVASDIQIFCLGVNGSSSSQATAVLASLARSTGGRLFPPRDSATAAAQAILESFRATYTVTYRLPTHATGFHLVQILPTHDLHLQFHSRSGYFYPTLKQ